MGLSYAPFDREEPPSPPWKPQPSGVVNVSNVRRDGLFVLGGPDVTECNHLIMFFVLGVFLLTLVDAIR